MRRLGHPLRYSILRALHSLAIVGLHSAWYANRMLLVHVLTLWANAATGGCGEVSIMAAALAVELVGVPENRKVFPYAHSQGRLCDKGAPMGGSIGLWRGPWCHVG